MLGTTGRLQAAFAHWVPSPFVPLFPVSATPWITAVCPWTFSFLAVFCDWWIQYQGVEAVVPSMVSHSNGQRQELLLERWKQKEKFIYFHERWSRIYRLRLKYANRAGCNEAICLTSTNNYIPITKAHVSNEDNCAAVAVGLCYWVHPGISHVFHILTAVLQLSPWHVSGISSEISTMRGTGSQERKQACRPTE